MCGICGIIQFNKAIQTNELQIMTHALKHRGPDDAGYVLSSIEQQSIESFHDEDSVAEIKATYPSIPYDSQYQVGMGFRRLAIFDTSVLGHQPMLNHDRSIALTFNGAIYNFEELRIELQQAGYTFKSKSDTEVVLYAYQYWGIHFIQKLNGMFAIALLDKRNNTMYLIRDRFGIKPLYYSQQNNALYWSSEIKALLKVPSLEKQLDVQGLYSNYLWQQSTDNTSCFKNIHVLAPGKYLKIDLLSHQISTHTYWDSLHLAQFQRTSTSIEHIEDLLHQIVKKQLKADVPIIAMLSGGIDSTTLSAIAKQYKPDLASYTLALSDQQYNELPQANAIATHLKLKSHIQQLHADDLLNDLDASLIHFEAPYTSIEPVVMAAKFMQDQQFKVVINGIGADELFGGYQYYQRINQWEQLQQFSWLGNLIPALPIQKVNTLQKFWKAKSITQFYGLFHEGMQLNELKQLVAHPLSISTPKQFEAITQLPISNIEKISLFDLQHNVSNHHVVREDLSYMKHSMEARYPYLDHELVEAVYRLKSSLVYQKNTSKPVLRSIAQKYILAANMQMPKKGFELPTASWLQNNKTLENYAFNTLSQLKKRALFNNKTIDLWWQQRNQPTCVSKLWQLISTEKMMATYLDA